MFCKVRFILLFLVCSSCNLIHANPYIISGDIQDVYHQEISPDSNWVVFIGDKGSDGVYELFSVPITGGTPVKISGSMITEGDVSFFNISADSQRVVFKADKDTDEVFELYSVPITGGTPIKISGTLVAGGDVNNSFKISADSQRVVFIADKHIDEIFELYSVPITGGTTPTKISGTLVAGGDVGRFEISANSQWIVFIADKFIDDVDELFSVAIADRSAIPIVLNDLLVTSGDVSRFKISDDSQKVVFRADGDSNDVEELYSSSIDGNTPPTKISGSLVAGGNVAYSFEISSDSQWVIFKADKNTNDIDELYSVPIAGKVPTKLSGTLISGGDVYNFRISADNQRVVFNADKDTDDVYELYSVPIGESSLPINLSGLLATGGDVNSFKISSNSQWVVFPADKDTDTVYELYSVPITGGKATKISGPLVSGGDVSDLNFGYQLSNDNQQVIFIADKNTDNVYELYSAPIEGGNISKLNQPLVSSNAEIMQFALSNDSKYAVYQAVQFQTELFAYEFGKQDDELCFPVKASNGKVALICL